MFLRESGETSPQCSAQTSSDLPQECGDVWRYSPRLIDPAGYMLIDFQRRLSERFSVLRDARHGVVFFIEHGLETHELNELRAAVRRNLRLHALDSDWWDGSDLPLLVASTEVGYRYRGSGTDFWPLLEAELEHELPPPRRQRIRNLFSRASDRFRGARPPTTAWAEAFHLIAWPISHALLPLEFHRPLAATLANLRVSAGDVDDATLYRAMRVAASFPNARFATLLEDADIVVSLARSLLRGEMGEISPEIISRLSEDLEADDVARRGVAVARNIQRGASAKAEGALPSSEITRTRGSLHLRLANALLLEASFPASVPEVIERLRRSLRRRRYAPQLWRVTARVPSDQLLSGLPFPLKLTALPAHDAPLLPDLETSEFDAEDLATLQGFELEFTLPQLFSVSGDGDIGRQVLGKTVSGHRKYWALLGKHDTAPSGVRTVGDVGPLRCFELDPGCAAGAGVLAQFGYDVRLGVSVRFAGAPSIDRGHDVPTFVAGDERLLIPQNLTGEAALVVGLNGGSAIANCSEAVRFRVEPGDHRLQVSSETDSREYEFRGVDALPPLNLPVRIDLRSEERSVQALLGGRLNFIVDGTAPIDGLELTLDLDVGGRVYSATGLLGTIPQPVSAEHAVMKCLLSDDVRDQVAGTSSATLRARVGPLAGAAWELERLVRPCWWDLRSNPTLLSEEGPLRFGAINAEDPIRAPIEGAMGDGTYLLAPVALEQLEFSATAPFATVCVAPNRTRLGALRIAKPRLERRRRGTRSAVGIEELAEAYLRWSLAETRSAIGDLHRGQVTARLEHWIAEVCCGPEWAEAEATLPHHQSAWRVLEQVCQEMRLGRDTYLELSAEQDGHIGRLAVDEIRRSMPSLWARVGPPSDLDEEDYEELDRACARAYEVLAEQYRRRGRPKFADELREADPGEPPDRWDEALARVRQRVELRPLAAMLLPSNTATRLIALELRVMTVDDVADELSAWAVTARKAFAGVVPSRDILKASYALWIEPELALRKDWRVALDMLLAERSVARATRYLALRARAAHWGAA
jgi:hypothetical protein